MLALFFRDHSIRLLIGNGRQNQGIRLGEPKATVSWTATWKPLSETYSPGCRRFAHFHVAVSPALSSAAIDAWPSISVRSFQSVVTYAWENISRYVKIEPCPEKLQALPAHTPHSLNSYTGGLKVMSKLVQFMQLDEVGWDICFGGW